MPGTLYVVATPIGNLEDLTFRALRMLKEVDLIAAEDTRRTAKLLAHYEIRRPMTSLREHNEARESMRLVGRLEAGESVALVTDAGTPGIADPGARFVSRARGAGIQVVAIPGPSAVTAALSISGDVGTEFVFMGFPPASGSSRTEWFKRLGREPRAVVCFESPHRLRRTVGQMYAMAELFERPILIHKELTKINEKLVVCLQKDIPNLDERGEHVIVVGPGQPQEKPIDEGLLHGLLASLRLQPGVTDEAAMALAASAFGRQPSEIRKLDKKRRYSVKQQNMDQP